MALCGRGVLESSQGGDILGGCDWARPDLTAMAAEGGPWLVAQPWQVVLAPGRAQKQGHRLQETRGHREGSHLCPPRWDSV